MRVGKFHSTSDLDPAAGGWCYVVDPILCEEATQADIQSLRSGATHTFMGAGKRPCSEAAQDAGVKIGHSAMAHETDRRDAMRLRAGWHGTHGTLYGSQRFSVDAKTPHGW